MKIAHVALYTPAFEQTLRFYEEVFGAKSLGQFQTDRQGCWLSLEGDILEVFESPARGDGAWKHIAIACQNVDAVYQKALEHGAKAHVEPKNISLELEQPLRARIAFLIGPSGEQIELFDGTLL